MSRFEQSNTLPSICGRIQAKNVKSGPEAVLKEASESKCQLRDNGAEVRVVLCLLRC